MPPTISAAAFPSFAQARAFLRLRDQDTSGDALLAQLIDAAAATFEAATGRRLKRRDYVGALVNGSGWTNLFLPEYPVASIASIKASATRDFANAAELVVFDGTGTQTSHDVVLTDGGDSGEVVLVNGDVWPEGPGTVLVSYSAGYGDDADDLLQAQLVLISDLWNLAGRDPKIASQSVGGLAQAYLNASHAPQVDAAIKAYKRASFEP